MYDFLAAAPGSILKELEIPGFRGTIPQDSRRRASFGVGLSAYLKQRPREERAPLFQSLSDAMARVDFPRTRMLNSSEIRSLAAAHDIGSHSHSHESMAHESHSFFCEDFLASREFFETTLGLALRTYAFPNGSSRPEQVRYLLDQGIRSVLLVGDQLARPASSPVLPRINLYADSPPEARLRSLGWRPRGLARAAEGPENRA
jgi:peptidoglycan/xylan/chitin deacetylase (PgdA/CDA1 family)